MPTCHYCHKATNSTYRNSLTSTEADNLIAEAREALHAYLEADDQESAHNICEEFFGLEPDYLMDLF